MKKRRNLKEREELTREVACERAEEEREAHLCV